MLKIRKRLLTTQILSIIYSIFTMSIIELIARVPRLEILIFFYIILIGFISFFMSRMYLDGKWMDIALICIPYIIYCLLVFAAYAILFPIDVGENNYVLLITIFLGIIGSLISIIISMILYKRAVSQN